MKKALFLIPLFLAIPTGAFASEASSSVEQHISSSSNNSSSTTSHTEIKVETNGNTTYYSSDKPGDVKVESVNGESKITENGVEVTGSAVSPTKKPETSVAPTDEDKDDEKTKDDKDEFREKIIEQLKRPFEMLRHLLFFWH